MRNVAAAGHARFSRVAVSLTVLMLSAAQASAQLVFDGNLLFNNGNTGTVAGQCVGAPTAAVLTCPLGYTAGQLATVSFPHNFVRIRCCTMRRIRPARRTSSPRWAARRTRRP
jgi:hypothetical protein